MISIEINLLSIAFPSSTLKKYIDKKWFQLHSICFQLVGQEWISIDINLLPIDFPFKP